MSAATETSLLKAAESGIVKAPSPGAAADAVSKPVVTKPSANDLAAIRRHSDTFALDKQDWTNPICCNAHWGCKLAFGTTRYGQCKSWCGISSSPGQGPCIAGDEVKEKREGCCADQPPCPKNLPACKF